VSYASIKQVRSHLVDNRPLADAVYNQAVVLTGTEWIRLFGGAIDPVSVAVKGRRSSQLTRVALVVGPVPVSVGASDLEVGSVVVASDSSLGHVYRENIDYTVDYIHGKIVVRTDGELVDGSPVTVWYGSYEPYQRDTDFHLDAENGSIRRLVSGRIVNGELVLVDYRPVYASFADEIVETATAEANGVIERSVDPGREFGADPSLSLAATYYALAIVCRAAASRALGAGGGDRLAPAWMKLADDYAARSEERLREFRPAVGGLHPPVRS
jgi:hypothetical protein